MPPMKIQPLEFGAECRPVELRDQIRADTGKVVLKSRLKRLFDRQFQSVLKITDSGGRDGGGSGAVAELEPSSLCLAKMVQNFIEGSTDKHLVSTKCGRKRCNCFKGNSNDSSGDELDTSGDQISSSTPPEPIDFLKSLVPCSSVAERNLLADASTLFEKNKLHKRKDEEMRRIVTDGLASLGYRASICKSRWDKSAGHPAGEYEYIDALVGGERLLIDIDFRSEFQIARPTGSYKLLLQSLPVIFVGKADRLQQIISIMSEAARQSLKKKGMPFPPWRKAEYMKSKWLAPHAREATPLKDVGDGGAKKEVEFEFNEEEEDEEVAAEMKKNEETAESAVVGWAPPAMKVKSAVVDKDGKAVTGLASLLKGKP
uniref:Uncharacterized protein n=1 Tax=Kalanchoe fedtschenkoi TaxID=63787 RepID=A0A7N0UDM7_KALFE